MASSLVIFFLSKKIIAWEVFIFEGTPSFLKKYQKGTPRFLIAVPQPQVILERPLKKPTNVGISYILDPLEPFALEAEKLLRIFVS